jgi:uncharacterized protein (DUF1330 family)
MSVYAVAQVTITNATAYERYRERFMDVMKPFTGRLLAADGSPQIVEGEWDREKVVLLWFPDEVAFWEFWNSAEYQEIAKDRKAGATAVVLLVKGITLPAN